VLGVIPARYGSTRFPGKPLAKLGGKAVLAHVVAHAQASSRLDRLVVATDDERIADCARSAGSESWMTPPGIRSGSDRVAHAMQGLAEQEGDTFDVVVNVQGDEPFLPADAIDRAVALLEKRPEAEIATLAVEATEEEHLRPDVVKVVTDHRGRALYFSRSPIPYPKHREQVRPLKHVGLYAFRAGYLEHFVNIPQGELELAEDLEQLRAMEEGSVIMVAKGSWPVLGIDTPEDLARAEARLASGRETKTEVSS
jgi:3-deoxy-manno-octulosonate cytidylyltransferase (CMP-KDO synthetase)